MYIYYKKKNNKVKKNDDTQLHISESFTNLIGRPFQSYHHHQLIYSVFLIMMIALLIETCDQYVVFYSVQ